MISVSHTTSFDAGGEEWQQKPTRLHTTLQVTRVTRGVLRRCVCHIIHFVEHLLQHHPDDFLVVGVSIAIHVGFPDHLFHFIVVWPSRRSDVPPLRWVRSLSRCMSRPQKGCSSAALRIMCHCLRVCEHARACVSVLSVRTT